MTLYYRKKFKHVPNRPNGTFIECEFGPHVKTGPDGGEHDKFAKRDELNLLGLLVAAIVLATFYAGFVAITSHLTQPEETHDELRSTDSDPERARRVRPSGLHDVPAD